MAGLLALMLFLSVLVSVNHSLHQSLHSDGVPGTHVCLVCSLAQGQVAAVEVLSVLAAIVLVLFFEGSLVRHLPSTDFDYRLSPSRAPPSR
jgi:hypothetical protein